MDDILDGEDWAVEPLTGAVHVIPLNDVRKHRESADCWCKPKLERKCCICGGGGCEGCSDGFVTADEPDGAVLVTHRAADGRE